jgi:hypothetical protein
MCLPDLILGQFQPCHTPGACVDRLTRNETTGHLHADIREALTTGAWKILFCFYFGAKGCQARRYESGALVAKKFSDMVSIIFGSIACGSVALFHSIP